VERTNKTAVELLKASVNWLIDSDWDDHLPFIMEAYRSTPHASTGLSPNMMVYGREINLPIDLMYHVHTEKRPWDSFGRCPTAYVEWLRRALQDAHEIARDSLQRAAERQKTSYNTSLRHRKFEVNDWVWKLYPPAAHPKLGRPYVGPYLVFGVDSDVV
jgi:hypothetical protein